MTGLQIPPAAEDAWFTCGCSEDACGRAGYQYAGLSVIVAAELRRIARTWGQSVHRDLLLERAERLDPRGQSDASDPSRGQS